jgi:hypothetical protein
MSNAIEKIELEFTEEELVELAEMSGDVAGEEIIIRLQTYCDTLAGIGLNPEILMAALLEVYCTQACEMGDRSLYEEQLNIALEDEWPEQWIH